MRQLLANGTLRPASLPPEQQPPAWGYRELAGRVVELCGEGATALLTVATGLVLEAQQRREPVVWITDPAAPVYPPDLADNGVDLSALLFVKVGAAPDMLRAADQVLRSGAFGLVVLDLPARMDVSLSAQVRLAGLAKRHDVVLVYLGDPVTGVGGPISGSGTSHGSGISHGNSLASLRAVSRRRRAGAGRFEAELMVCKDKRRGREWCHRQTFDGAVGLR